jgi:lipopolysaccharide transport system permease protein
VVRESPFPADIVTVIEPPRGWRLLDVKEVWAYRELLGVLVARDIKVRYRQTVLGAAWAVIRPVLAMVVFSAIFGHLAGMPSDGLPYPIFVYAGLLPWTFFAAAVTSCSQSIVASSGLVGKVYFPRLIIPMSSVGANLVDLLVATAVLLAMMAWYGVGGSAHLLAAPLLMLGVVIAALGFGTLLSALTVAYRDINHVTPFLLQVWMYVTPVIFPTALVPDAWRWLLYLNPMTGLVEGFRSAFLARPFDLAGLTWSLAVSMLCLAGSIAYFQKVERRFADIV